MTIFNRDFEPVYCMTSSFEEGRPEIDFSAHRFCDEWKELEQEFPAGIDTMPCKQIRFQIDSPDALNWDWYSIARTGGAISQRARDLLWPYARQHLRSFQSEINGCPYYILRIDRNIAIDCLDRDRSRMKLFDSDPSGAMYITQYEFRRGILYDPLIFHVPESTDILCTCSIKQIVSNAGLKGFHFQDAKRAKTWWPIEK